MNAPSVLQILTNDAKGSFPFASLQSSLAAVGEAESVTLGHHVVAAVVAVALSALALAREQVVAQVLDIGNTLGALQIVAAVVSGIEKAYIVVLHVLFNLFGRCLHV